MVAKINTSKNISRALNYNEQKVQQGQAEILLAQNFLKDADSLNFYNKLHHFERLLLLNERTTTNTLHVSLNFDPSEQDLSNEKLEQIAKDYMEKIGFGKQPFLVYRHYDAGHPHIHIVTINIQNDGSRISMHNLGKNQSETARKEIENQYGLVKAESKRLTESLKIVPVSAQKVSYGRLATKQAISNVLAIVINQYKYSSLAELNAVLKLYNVVAEQGKGISFRVLDEQGNKISAPIKASAFYMRPTIKVLNQKFAVNDKLKTSFAKRLKSSIDFALLKQKNQSLEKLIMALGKERISVVLRTNEEGRIYGITYIDHKSRCVFNGSDLDKVYSAAQVIAHCNTQKSFSLADEKKESLQPELTAANAQTLTSESHTVKLIDELMTATDSGSYTPYQLRKKKKRKRKQLKL